MNEKEVNTYFVWIYVAGDLAEIKKICQEYCEVGLCVTVEPLDYIYTGGRESGARIGLISYPRFPSDPETIWDEAIGLSRFLRANLYQDSVLVMDNQKTVWISSRE